MAGKTQTHENAVLNTARATTLTSWSPYVGVFTVNPTDTAGGTELTGAGRQAVTFGAPAGNPAQMSNSADVVWLNLSNGGTIIGWGIFDAPTGGNLRYWFDCADVVVVAGNNLRFAAGTLIVQED